MPTFYQHTQIGYKYLSAMIYIFLDKTILTGQPNILTNRGKDNKDIKRVFRDNKRIKI